MTHDSRLTVLGAGNAGLTTAYHLSRLGAAVCLYGSPGFTEQIDAIRRNGGRIRALAEHQGVELELTGEEEIHLLSEDIEEAVVFSRFLFLPVPSYAQEPLFRSMLPFLSPGQVVVLMPGNFGSLALRKIQRDLGYSDLDLTFLETITIPWACRICGPAQLAIFGIKRFLPLAALPAERTEELIAQLTPLLPIPLRPLENVLAAGLENINFGAHPLQTVLNIGCLENAQQPIHYYRDCCSRSTDRATRVMEEERLAIGRALDLELVPELEALNALYGLAHRRVYDFNRQSETHGKILSAPTTSRHRYITEDAPYLLLPIQQLGELAGVEAPVITSCLILAGAMTGEDFFATGRSLEKLGLAGMTVEEILRQVA